MRTLLRIALATALCGVLYGCGGSKDEATKEPSKEEKAPTTTASTDAGHGKEPTTTNTNPANTDASAVKPTEGKPTDAKPSKETGKKDDGKAGYVTTASGLKYKDEVVGRGAGAQKGQTVLVHYRGTLENGTKFDSSYDRGQPYEVVIGVSHVIEGWHEGLVGMKVGGKRKIVIPPSLGYGDVPNGPIPANSTLLFDLELIDLH